ncbi:glycosyltransferase family 39 protein [Hymenobacter defluvii]|uniref:Glycosyltransferase family 39 protein n=1 Tax=Hymenobacter defluvii TaxID=2054411 RepID=A0ABS3T7S4_9BACT|nr:glycosyltransferase family 39 protein [Hymenobacter defluvii]MBO3269278.1 glycosyltransferase family 39 protein [Hymenobacter defluvii]
MPLLLQNTIAQRRLYPLFFILICLVGAALRLIQFPTLPPGFNQDEASSAYEAYCLAETGMDRWGNTLPVYFPSWGSGQNVLLSYLMVPVVKIFGLSISSARLIPVALGIFTLPLLGWGLRPLGRYPSLLGMFLVAIVPWHFMMSRWALESNLVPFFMLLGCVLLSRALITHKRRWIIPSLLPFALALYAYGTTIIVLPIMVMLIGYCYRRHIWQHRKVWLLASVFFVIVAFPFIIFIIEHHILNHNMAWADSLFFSTPLPPFNRLAQINPEQRLDVLYANRTFFNSGFQDGSVYNLMPNFPLLLLFSLPIGLIGMVAAVFVLIRQLRRRTTQPSHIVITIFLFWALGTLPMIFLFTLNVNRFNHFYLPLMVLMIWLVDLLIEHTNTWVSKPLLRTLVVMWLVVESGFAVRHYFTSYRSSGIRTHFYEGLDQAFNAVKQLPVAQVQITSDVHYIYALFFTQYPPQDFQQHAQYSIRNDRYEVFFFGKYVFDDAYLIPNQPHGYLMRRNELPADTTARHVIFRNELWEVGISR